MGGQKHEVSQGFPGNLTSEQEDKLKEMYSKLLTYIETGKTPVSGVEADSNAEGGDEEKDNAPPEKKGADDDSAKDKKKKEQEKKELAALLSKSSPEEFEKRFWLFVRGESPDSLMLRFLRARKWDVDRGFMMLAGAIKFRIERQVDEIRTNGELGECDEPGFALQFNKGKSYFYGTDKSDRPIVYIHVAIHKPSEQSQESLEKYVIYNMETARTLLPPDVTQATLCFDMTGFGLKNMDWNCILFIAKCLEAYYPETLGLMIIHNAPFVFWGIWKMLAPLLDPVVRSKVDFTRSKDDLFKYIDPKHVKKDMGGDADYTWHYEGCKEDENSPQDDTEAKKKFIGRYNEACNEWMEVTKKWIKGDKEAGKKREEILTAKIAITYLDSEPYMRGRTTYNRRGICIGDGRVRWEYNGDEEVWGESWQGEREKVGVEGKFQLNEAGKEDEGETASSAQNTGQSQKPGGPASKLKTAVVGGVSKVTPGPSKAQQEKKEQEEREERERKEKEKKEKERKEKEKKEQEERQKQEEEESKKSNGGQWLESARQSAASGGSTLASGAGSAGSGLASAAGYAASGAASSGKTIASSAYSAGAYGSGMLGGVLNSTGDYVPAALGGNYLKQVPAPNSDFKSERAPGAAKMQDGYAVGS